MPRSLLLFLLACLVFPGSGNAYFIQLSNNSIDPHVSPEQFRPAADGSHPRPGTPPLPVEIEVLPLPPAMPAGKREAIRQAVKTWDSVPGSAMDVSVRFREGEYDHAFPDRHREADGSNTLEFIPSDWPDFWGSNVICMTVPKLDDQGRIMEADMFCNDEHYRWTVFPGHGSFPELVPQKRVDVQALVTHELGHVLGIGHSQYSWASMFWLPGIADTRCRRLSEDDKQALRNLYPKTQADLAPPSVWGVHRDNFSGDRCGLDSYITTRISAVHYYREANNARLELSSPPAAGDEVVKYCMFGSGFTGGALTDMDVLDDGVALDAATAAEYVSPTFVKARIMNGAGGYPELAAGAYDLSASNPGGTGALFQGLLVNPSGNELPRAVILPGCTFTEPGRSVLLSGLNSFDPEGADLGYNWSVAAAPQGAAGVLSSATSSEVHAYLPRAGLYVIRLITSDGIADSIADQVVIRAEYSAGASDEDDDYSPFGCACRESRGPASAGLYLFLLVFPLFITFIVVRRLQGGARGRDCL